MSTQCPPPETNTAIKARAGGGGGASHAASFQALVRESNGFLAARELDAEAEAMGGGGGAQRG